MESRESSRLQQTSKLERMAEVGYPVMVDPVPITTGEEVTVLYRGNLAESGYRVWMRTGYGPADKWRDVSDSPMEKTGWGWAKKLTVWDTTRLNLCFHNELGQWDNNYNHNWSYEIHNGNLPEPKNL